MAAKVLHSPRTVDRRAPFLVVMNAAAGSDNTRNPFEIIERTLRTAGRTARLIRVDRPERLGGVARDTVGEGQRTGGVVVVAGGDGTINSVVNAVYGSGCSLGVIPQGTFSVLRARTGFPKTRRPRLPLLRPRVRIPCKPVS